MVDPVEMSVGRLRPGQRRSELENPVKALPQGAHTIKENLILLLIPEKKNPHSKDLKMAAAVKTTLSMEYLLGKEGSS